MKRLIVTADDFGASREVNDAVECAHRDGILTAASLMVGAPAAADAVARAQRMPFLKVGLHLVLIEGRPVLPPEEVPDLVDASGSFRSGMVSAGVSMFFNPRVRRQLAAEMTAQFAAFRAMGLQIDHLNAHKHFHLHPVIGRLLVEIGQRFGLRAVRVPIEPRRVLAKIEPHARYAVAWDTLPWAYLLRRRLRAAGMLLADHMFGLAWSGAMTAQRLSGLIRNVPEGLTEIYLHPATAGGFAGAAPNYRYSEELAALLSQDAIAASREPSIRMGGFADFLRPTEGMAPVRANAAGSKRSSTP